MSISKREYVWSIADFIRNRLHLTPPLSIKDIFEIVELSGGRCVPSKNQLGKRFDPHLRVVKEKDAYFEIIYDENEWEPGLLFCVAHELGHLFLHLLDEHGKIRKDILICHSSKESSIEWEANEFAAQLLMPQEEFISFCCTISKKDQATQRKIVDVNQIAHYFGVSTQAAMVRGEILGLW